MLLSLLCKGRNLDFEMKAFPGKLLFGNCCDYEIHQAGCLVATERKLPFLPEHHVQYSSPYFGAIWNHSACFHCRKMNLLTFFRSAVLILEEHLRNSAKKNLEKQVTLMVAESIINKPKYLINE